VCFFEFCVFFAVDLGWAVEGGSTEKNAARQSRNQKPFYHKEHKETHS